MPVIGINHVNIRTTDVAASIAFYTKVFGFIHQERPAVQREPGNWLFDAKGQPIIHFRIKEPDAISTGPIDHVALSCCGKAEIVRTLEAYGIKYAMTDNLADGGTQIFLIDPHGVALELNFAGE